MSVYNMHTLLSCMMTWNRNQLPNVTQLKFTDSQLAFCNIKPVYQISYTHVKNNRWMRNRVKLKEWRLGRSGQRRLRRTELILKKLKICFRVKYTSVNRSLFKKIRHRKISRHRSRSLFWLWPCYVLRGQWWQCETRADDVVATVWTGCWEVAKLEFLPG
jgi:hypothetical protein